MTTLKQVLITIAAAAVSVHASPLSADSTATAIIGGPEPAVTEVSKPLKGKELEDFVPYTPEGAIDVTNTTLGFELVKGDCPDFNAAFDFFSQRYVNAVNGGAVVTWGYYGRWNDCGQCGRIQISGDGCFDFTSCGRKQSICVDTGHARAHRIWHDVGHKTCYNAARADLGNCGVVLTNSIIWYPTGETVCNW
ncbi:hypothetical protein CCHR01_04261 [Colletotrichum chrysophilum]|uniref:Secreted protein n=1 Tax=Colletotrichum chrysophilum TaxID=1836956 RepID=A0AAD9AS74_9PEZI|nr:hypothetical protein CCHR01_04261 [Colletotrichum chrysophilum]